MRPTDLELELFLVGDLSPADAERVQRAADEDPALATYLQSRRADQAAFALSRPRLTLEAPAPTWWARWRRWVAPFGASVAVGAALLLFVELPAVDRPVKSAVRARGDALMATLIVRRGDVVFRVDDKTPLRPQDQLRIEVDLKQRAACSAIGVDAHGVVSTLYDEVSLSAGRTLFPRSVVLDDAPGEERVVVGCGMNASALADAWLESSRDAKRSTSPREKTPPISILAYEKEPTPQRP